MVDLYMMRKVIRMTKDERLEARQKLITYIRANLKRYISRLGDEADKQFIKDVKKLIAAYDNKND